MVKLLLTVAISSLAALNFTCNRTERTITKLSFDVKALSNFPSVLRGDGYYHRIDTTSMNIEILIFSTNGKLFRGYFQSRNQMETFLRKKEVIIENVYYDFATYYCEDEVIAIKYLVPVEGNELVARWEVFTKEGKIIDDTTLLFTKGYRNKISYNFNHTYNFVQGSVPVLKFNINKQSNYRSR